MSLISFSFTVSGHITIFLPWLIAFSICLQISLFLGSLSNIIIKSPSKLLKSAPAIAIQLSRNKLSSGPSTTRIGLLLSTLSRPKILSASSSSLIVIYLGVSEPNALPWYANISPSSLRNGIINLGWSAHKDENLLGINVFVNL